jgi:hypothetical protein
MCWMNWVPQMVRTNNACLCLCGWIVIRPSACLHVSSSACSEHWQLGTAIETLPPILHAACHAQHATGRKQTFSDVVMLLGRISRTLGP